MDEYFLEVFRLREEHLNASARILAIVIEENLGNLALFISVIGRNKNMPQFLLALDAPKLRSEPR